MLQKEATEREMKRSTPAFFRFCRRQHWKALFVIVSLGHWLTSHMWRLRGLPVSMLRMKTMCDSQNKTEKISDFWKNKTKWFIIVLVKVVETQITNSNTKKMTSAWIFLRKIFNFYKFNNNLTSNTCYQKMIKNTFKKLDMQHLFTNIEDHIKELCVLRNFKYKLL